MLSNFFKNESYKLTIIGVLVLTVAGVGLFALPARVSAQVSGLEASLTATFGSEDAVAILAVCAAEFEAAGATSATGLSNDAAVIACMTKVAGEDAAQLWKKNLREEVFSNIKDEVFKSIAGGFKASLQQFLQQFSYDVSTWIASGGKGQKPLFITEGWGAYLRNSADEALGTFIDSVDKEFGTNLCRPNFAVRIGMIRGLEQSIGRGPRKPKCNFTEIVSNWQTAVRNPQLMTEYTNFLQPGNNDVSSFLMLQTGLGKSIDQKLNANIAEGVSNAGWKPLTDKLGQVLTPGTAVRKAFEKTVDDSNKGELTFTGTIWDFIESFLNSLMAGLLNNLQQGLFASDSGSDQSKFSLPNLQGLLKYEAAPYVEGRQGAKERFSTLVESQVRVGGSYNVLVKLTQCTDAAKTNPGPTDCVLDQNMSAAIRNRKLVKQLGDMLDRPFVPAGDEVLEASQAFTLRNIVIMRKYRIVPVGWEIAARYLAERDATVDSRSYTLRDIMSSFSSCPEGKPTTAAPFCGLIDPNWVLKAPELFCRREGFGEKNDSAKSQDGTVQRAQYCADEQQCLEEDDAGNCLVYGYCTTERRAWDFTGKTCEPLYNTCQTVTGRTGQSNSYLANTLDYRNCNSQNAGCVWYSGVFNPTDNDWSHKSDTSYRAPVANNNGESVAINVSNQIVLEYHTTSNDGRLVMDQPCGASSCTATNQCTFTPRSGLNPGKCTFNNLGQSCTIAKGATRCSLTTCTEDRNLFATANGDFNSCSTWNAAGWIEGYNGDNNRHSCAAGGITSNGLELLAINNIEPIITRSAEITVVPGQRYQFSFSGKVFNFSSGGMVVNVIANGVVVSSIDIRKSVSDWQTYSIGDYITAPGDKLTIEVVTQAGTVGRAMLDNFSLKPEATSCAGQSVWLTTAQTPVASTPDLGTMRYFDRDVQGCDGKDAGCTQFIRTAAGLRSNLLPNSSFEIANPASADQAMAWSGDNAHRVADRVLSGSQAIQLDVVAGDNLSTDYGYDGTVPLRSRSRYALSASVNSTVDTMVAVRFNGANESPKQMARAGTWTQISYILTTGNVGIDASPEIIVYGSTTTAGRIYLDNVKLEEVTYNATIASGYSDYAPDSRPQEQIATLKKAPDHYQCYDANTSTTAIDWPQNISQLNNLPSAGACSNYAQACLASEVGCELYTPLNKIDPNVPGRLTQADYCPVETRAGAEYGICDGYQVYKQEQTNFTTGKYTQFIADNQANYCSAAHAGCDAFTNLDAVAAGGESTAYFSQVRACQKPAPDGRNYYTWEGSDTTGYQLKAYTLKVSNIDNAPCTVLRYNDVGVNFCENTVSGDTTNVEKKIAEGICDAGEEKTNADCRAFYDTIGGKHYRLLSKTISNTNSCVPFRRNQTQGDLVQAKTDCDATGGRWNENACIYDVVPDQGRQCPATASGCREYTGNRGNNVRNLFLDDFESGAGIWVNGTLSNNTNYPGGTSLGNKNRQLSRPVRLTKNRAYQLSFWAKADGGTVNLDSIRFNGSNQVLDSFALGSLSPNDRTRTQNDQLVAPSIAIGGEWQRYDLGPVFVTWSGADATQETFDDTLVIDIPIGGQIFIDNVVLKEIQQKVYVIENSWETPVACDNSLDDPDGAQAIAAGTCQTTPNSFGPSRCAPGEMLGCQAYTNRASQAVHVKSFDQICRPGAVGCEMMIDTHNSQSPFAETYLADNAGSRITTPADNIIYLVNDRKYNCAATARGCKALGLPIINAYDEVTGYNTVYLKDQPDRYSTDVCQNDQLWCEEYTTGRSTIYFKDPRSKLCEYRTDIATTTVNSIQTQAATTGWFQKGTNNPCVVSNFQTVGKNTRVNQPIGWFNNETGTETTATTDNPAGYTGFAGSCPASANSCTEFIDPLAKNYNEVFATTTSFTTNTTIPRVTLDSYTLYTLAAQVQGDAAIVVDCAANIWSPDASMLEGRLLATGIGERRAVSGRFYIGQKATRACDLRTSGSVSDITITKTGVYYSLANSIDRTSCSGVVDYNEGCIPVNDRSELVYSESDVFKRNQDYLSIDADATYAQQMVDPDQRPVSPQRPPANLLNQRNANSVIKGTPDRVCDAWLYCTTYEKSSQSDDSRIKSLYGNYDRCLDIGLCTAFNDKRECANLVTGANLAADNAPAESYTKTDAYRSGYSLVGEENILSVQTYYPVGEMRQEGGSANIVNGNFESVFGASEPIGWRVDTSQSVGTIVSGFREILGTPITRPNTSWSADRFSVVNDIKQAPEGGRYLRLNSYFAAESEDIDVQPNTQYTLSGWINTLDLKSNGGSVVAEILIKDKAGETGTIIYDDIAKEAGQNWEYVTFDFITSGSSSIVIRLENFIDIGTKELCKQSDKPDNTNPCPITGFSRFDNIELKPVLQASQDVNISRSCRMYPAQNALSCQYTDGNNNFYGQYGYCLTVDPLNPKQCLQWFPIDQLAGELSSELTGYTGRRPLYYCIEKKKVNIDLKSLGMLVNIGEGLPSDKENFAQAVDSGTSVNVQQFRIPIDYRSLFRWPYIQRMNFTGTYLAIGSKGNPYPLPLNANMYRDKVCVGYIGLFNGITGENPFCYHLDVSESTGLVGVLVSVLDGLKSILGLIPGIGDFLDNLKNNLILTEEDIWGGWGMIGVGIKSIPIPIALPVPWHAAAESGSLNALMSAATDLLGDDFGGSGTFGMKIVTDSSGNYSGTVNDPVPGLPGDILGVAWFLDTSGAFAAGGVIGAITGDLSVEYCSQMVEVVTSAGGNKAWLARTSQGSGYVSPDRDCAAHPENRDEESGLFNRDDDDNSTEYDADFTPGQWPFNASGATQGDGPRDEKLCAVQEKSDYTIIGYNYQTDYPPFGAVVQPGNSQYPDGWDSKDAQGIQPLYYEIRNPEIPGAGQPRMGQLHSIADLKGLFAKVYSIWKWNDEVDAYGQADTITTPNSGSGVISPWSPPDPSDATQQCFNNIRPTGAGQDDGTPAGGVYSDDLPQRADFCYVNPVVTAVQFSPSTVKGYGPVALTFNVTIDPEQLPIRAYEVDWGDGEKTTMSGIALRDRANSANPFVLYHFYDYRKVIGCQLDAPSCSATVTIKVTDNWGASGDNGSGTTILIQNTDAY